MTLQTNAQSPNTNNPIVFGTANTMPVSVSINSNIDACGIETPTIGSSTGILKIDDGVTLEYPLLDLLNMFIFQGKKLDRDVKEYIDVILRAPNMDNIRAMGAFKRFKQVVEGNNK